MSNLLKTFVLLSILLLVGVALAQGDIVDVGKPAIKAFTDREGLPQNSIRRIAFDGAGRLWVGTADGAAYYNGRVWTVVNMPNRTVSNDVLAVLPAKDASMWFGTFNGGAIRLKDGEWSIFDTAAGLPSNWVKFLLEDSRGRVWASTDKGVAVYEGGQWRNVSTGLPALDVKCLLETGRGELLAGTVNGVARLEGERWVSEVAGDRLPNPSVRAMIETQSHGKSTLWIGIFGGGVAEVVDGNIKIHSKASGLADDSVLSLQSAYTPQREPVLWVGTYNGLARFWRGQWTTYNTARGLPSNDIRALAATSTEDGMMLLWVGTNSGGLVRMSPAMTVFDKSVGLSDNGIFSILEAKDGSYWFGTYNGLTRYKDGRWTVYNEKDGLPGNVVSALGEVDGQLWVGTTNGGIARFDGSGFTVYDTKNGLPHNTIMCILGTRSDDGRMGLWVGTYNGLVRIEDKPKTHILEQLPNKYVTAVVESGKEGSRTLWVGTRKGLARYRGGRWDLVRGLPSEHIISLMVTESNQGEYLWVGTNGGGLARALISEQMQWESLSDSTQPPLPNNVVYQMRQDSQGRVYVMTNKGVGQLLPGKDASRLAYYSAYFFKIEDGLPGNECNQGAGVIDRAGRLWIGTVAGAVVYDSKLEVRARKAPALIIEKLLLNGSSVSRIPERLAYDDNNLSFEYSLPSYFRESENAFRTQLVGFEARPSSWASDSKREYTNLPEGSYTFRVWGRDYAGNETAPVELSFSIGAAPWRTWWAYTLYLTAIIATGYAVYRHRLQKFQRKQEERIGYLLKLLESTRAVNSQLELSQVLEKIAAESARLVDGEPGGIGLVEGDRVVFRRVWKQGAWVDTRIEFPLGQGVAGKVAESGQSILVNDPASDARIAYPELVKEYAVHGFVEVPIFDRNQRVVGVLEVRRRPGTPELTDSHRQLIESFAHHAAVAIENANLYGALEEKNLMIVESLREIEKLYENEQQVNRRLQQLDRMKNNFMAVTSHEMRTPLTVLKGYLETLTEGYFGALTAGQQKRLSVCLKTLDRLVGSLNVILEMLRIEERRFVLRREPTDLCQLLRQICDEMEVFLDQRQQSFILDFAEGGVMVDADKEKLSLVFLNLLQNAIKFTPDGGKIRVGCRRFEAVAEVVVEDEGIGLEGEDLERIFDKFYTTDDATTHSSGTYQFGARGVGLGLSVARSYVEAHGGRICAESEGRGRGSRFRVTLPLLTLVEEREESLTATDRQPRSG